MVFVSQRRDPRALICAEVARPVGVPPGRSIAISPPPGRGMREAVDGAVFHVGASGGARLFRLAAIVGRLVRIGSPLLVLSRQFCIGFSELDCEP